MKATSLYIMEEAEPLKEESVSYMISELAAEWCELFLNRCCVILSMLLFILNTSWSELVIDALWLYFIFMAAAAGCWRPAARPAGQLAETQKTLRVSLSSVQRSSCWKSRKRERNQRVSEKSILLWTMLKIYIIGNKGCPCFYCKLSQTALCDIRNWRFTQRAEV